jgi:hypothetical protein
VKITTETGSVYNIDDHGICVKTDKDGNRIDSFKPFTLKPVPDSVHSWQEVHEIPNSYPVVGQRMYIGGLNMWWLTTLVVSIEE